MPQDQETGAAGRAYGLRMGNALAKLLGAAKLSPTSNEVRWNGKTAVIKACRPKTSSFGVTAAMLQRLDSVLVALEDERGNIQVHDLPAESFRSSMCDSRSSGSEGGRVKMVSRRTAVAEGKLVARFAIVDVVAADEAG